MTVTTLQELLSLDDVPFVQAAYQTLLGRDADFGGRDFYVRRLREGVSKIIILGQLRASEEGRVARAEVSGLDEAIRRAKLARKPVIGFFMRLIRKVEGDSPIERRGRTLANEVALLRSEVAALREDNQSLQQVVSAALAAKTTPISGSNLLPPDALRDMRPLRSASYRGAQPGVMERFFAETVWKI